AVTAGGAHRARRPGAGTRAHRCRCAAPAGNQRGRSCLARACEASMRRRACGFSLLEVLVALAVLALALFALSRTASVTVQVAAHREEALLAGIVAANVLAEIRLADPDPAPGRREGRQRQGGREFYWQAVIGDTDAPGIRRIDVAVAIDPARDDTRVRLTGFAGRRCRRAGAWPWSGCWWHWWSAPPWQ